MLDEAFEKAKALLTARRGDLDAGSRLLLDRETITPADFPPLLRQPQTVAGASHPGRAAGD